MKHHSLRRLGRSFSDDFHSLHRAVLSVQLSAVHPLDEVGYLNKGFINV